jgi:hypothetical protein
VPAGATEQRTATDGALRILFIGGSGRSGSTLLGRALAEAPGAVCVGETHYLWSRALRDGARCGCGSTFSSCAFWGEVGARAYGGWGNVEVQTQLELDRATNRLRVLPMHRMPAARPGLAARLDAYSVRLGRLYEAIARVSGASMVVETSKAAPFASLLTRIPGADVRIVHLVRDSRAVAHSWTRAKRMPSPVEGSHYMPRFPVRAAATNWLAQNLAFHLLARRQRYLRISYEDLSRSPASTFDRLGSFSGHDLARPAEQLARGGIELGPHHIFSGNPMRESTGYVPLVPDDEWRAKLSPSDFTQITAITAPLLLRYGYPLARAPR